MTTRPRIAHRFSRSILILLFMAMGSSIQAQTVNRKGVDPGVFKTPVTTADLDQANDVQWCNGQTQPADTADGKFNIIWTTTTVTHHRGLSFGDSRDLGMRHVRLSLKRPVPIGSVLVNGNARLSVLNATVQGAGDLTDESQWIAAQRMDGREITTEQPGGQSITLWVLPPDTKTRALRFSYEPKPTDSKFQGVVSGLYIMSDRYVNIAGQAHVTASENPKDSGRLIDGQNNAWGTWDNGDKGQSSVISPQNPVWLQLDFPSPVSLRGMEAYACGSKTVAMDVLPESFEGPLGGALEDDWKRIKTADNLWDFYPSQLRPSFLDMGKDITVRAVRMVMLAPHDPNGMHPHMMRRPADGKRVWLDELQALMPLGDKPLESAVLQGWEKHDAHPPIAVKFHLDQPGNVTLVIDDADGKRVRNLIAQTPYPAGDNIAWWDGLDDLGRDVDAAAHGLYHVPGNLVQPGKFTVRGFAAPPIELTYEVSVDHAGSPPWPTPDNRGGWGTNHTPPSCVAVIPADRSDLNQELIFVGSYIAEGGHGIFWVDMDGNKQGGKHWLGGHWTGAQTVTGDVGPTPDPNTAVYVVSGFSGEIRFVALNRSLDEVILNKYKLVELKKKEKNVDASVGDIAAHNGLIVASLPNVDALWLFDAVDKKLLGKININEPFAVAFKPDGTLLATSGNKLTQITLDRGTLSSIPAVTDATTMPQITGVQTKTLPMTLDHPRGMTVLANGNIAITEQGTHHQLRIYSPAGKLVQSIGNPGQPTIGTYDPNHMNKPQGVGVDTKGRFWIAEANTQPKRVSLWNAQGKLAKAWYGPSRYGGGGTLDPYDRTLFYNAGMEFKIDWKTGDSTVQRILMLEHDSHNPDADALPQFPSNQHAADGMPEQAHRVNGRKFFSNWHNGSPTNGTLTVTIWEDKGNELLPVAAMGNAYGWWVTESEPFKSQWPEGTPHKNQHEHPVYFTWQDTNHNGICEPSETTLKRGKKSGITIMPDLSFVTAIDDKIVQFKPIVTSSEMRYDFENPIALMQDAQRNVSSGGSTYMLMPDNRVIAYPPTLPYSNYGLGGGIAGKQADWSYPNMWPGLHPSHNSATPQFPGMVIGPTRLIGEPITPRNSDIGPLWFLNANMGNIYVFTSDGLFVTELFHDSRTTTHWRMPVAKRGMRVDHLTLGDETFWPTVTQVVDDGDVFVCTGTGSASTLVQVHNLDKAKRLPAQSLTVDQDMLKECLNWQVQSEATRLASQVPSLIAVPISDKAITVDGKLDEWQSAQWATIDQRGNKAYFNSNAMPYDVSAAMQVVGDKLYIAWRTTEKNLLQNSGEIDIAPFKTGGALDLMIASDPNAKPDRNAPVAGDQRLIITQIGADRRKLANRAVLYKAIVPGTPADQRVPFTSPVQTISFDAVTEVTAHVQLAQNEGDFEVSIPLAVLGLKPKPGMAIKGDLGVLRGTLGKTTQRVYWSNKATAITADVPSEAQLLPKLWGTLVFE